MKKIQEEIERAWKEAVSFPDSKPPGKEIGRKRVNGRTYIFYKDDKGKYFYSSVPGLKFAKQMESAMKRRKKKTPGVLEVHRGEVAHATNIHL